MRRIGLAVALITLLLVTSAAASAPKPKPTKTPTPTPAAGCAAPIAITAGGTYTGCWESTDLNVAAVQIATSAPVTINNATVRHRGRGIIESPNGRPVDLTVTSSTLTALGPMLTNTTTSQRSIDLDAPTALVAEHNTIKDGGGIWVGKSGGSNLTTLQVRFNDATNIARYQPDTCSGESCMQFFQAAGEFVAGDVSWNRITNHYGSSRVEDNINLYGSGGTSDSNRFTISHNLIDGAYPQSFNGDYTGSCVNLGDSSGQYATVGPANRCINTTGQGFMIAGGQHNRVTDNFSVHDNRTDTGVLAMSTGSDAAINWCYAACGGPVDNDITGNTLGLERVDGSRHDLECPAADLDPESTCAGNTNYSPSDITAADEQAQRDAWAMDLAAASYHVGP